MRASLPSSVVSVGLRVAFPMRIRRYTYTISFERSNLIIVVPYLFKGCH